MNVAVPVRQSHLIALGALFEPAYGLGVEGVRPKDHGDRAANLAPGARVEQPRRPVTSVEVEALVECGDCQPPGMRRRQIPPRSKLGVAA